MRVSVFRWSTMSECGCRGARSCLLCERQKGLQPRIEETSDHVLYQCHNCGRIGPVEECVEDPSLPPLHTCAQPCTALPQLSAWPDQRLGECAPFEGVTIVKEFISHEEEVSIVAAIDGQPWANSQSGRRKQDYGPRVNFKKRKLKLGTFSGLPAFSEQLVGRMRREVEGLADFTPVELCNLDYQPERGSCIEPHLDDSWIWGERLVTLNLLSPIFLTFTHTPPSSPSPSHSSHVHIPLLPRSLLVVQGPARHVWLHSVQRKHIIARRVGITLRELANEFLPGGEEEESGRNILEVAKRFCGSPTSTATVS